ncbi:hypothetical protein IWZ01DRAFT_486035 [Phyllosticta capitalensis]
MANTLKQCDAEQVDNQNLEKMFPPAETENDFTELWLSEEFSDATLLFDNGTTLAVHQTVLAKRSDFFRELFRGVHSSGRRYCLYGPNKKIDSESIHAVVQHLYSQKYPDISGQSGPLMHLQLLNAAHFCQVSRLEKMALHAFKTTTVKKLVENLGKVVLYTYRPPDDSTQLRNFLAQFYVDNYEELPLEQKWMGQYLGQYWEFTKDVIDLLVKDNKALRADNKALKAQLEEKKLPDAPLKRDTKSTD